jgi:ABC-type nitrate/sulfonate/bicarbonate transport system permease component
MPARLRPIVFLAALLVLWQLAVNWSSTHLLPGPIEAVRGIGELLRHALLVKYVTAHDWSRNRSELRQSQKYQVGSLGVP